MERRARKAQRRIGSYRRIQGLTHRGDGSTKLAGRSPELSAITTSNVDLVVIGGGSARLRSDDGHDGLPKAACGTPMTAHSPTPGTGFNGRFDFGGIDVVATRNDEVLGASGMWM